MSAGHVMSEATLVNVNKGPALLLVSLNLVLEGAPFGDVRLWMVKDFFYIPLSCHNPNIIVFYDAKVI